MTDENSTPVEEKEVAIPEATEEKNEDSSHKESSDDQRRDRRPKRRGRNDRQPREPKEFEEAILQIARVTRVVKGGRRLRFRVSVVIGDQKGRVGFGIGKATEVMVGIQKAVAKAKKDLVNVPIFNGTIPHEINETYKSSRVLLFPAPEGKGVIAGGAVRRILELAGVKDVLSKVHGSRNKLNVARATMSALTKLQNKPPYGFKSKEEKKEEKVVKKEELKKEVAKKEAIKEAPKEKAAPKKSVPKKSAKK